MKEREVALALLPSRAEAESAITALVAAGIAAAEISVLQRDDGVLEHVMQHAAGTAANDGRMSPLGSLTALGSIPCAGIGNLVAAGTLRLVLDASTERSVTGALRAVGATEERAAMYERRIREGAILLAVHTSEGGPLGEARRVLTEHAGYEISVAIPSSAAPRPS